MHVLKWRIEGSADEIDALMMAMALENVPLDKVSRFYLFDHHELRPRWLGRHRYTEAMMPWQQTKRLALKFVTDSNKTGG